MLFPKRGKDRERKVLGEEIKMRVGEIKDCVVEQDGME